MVALLISWVFAGWMSMVFGIAGASLLASRLHEDRNILRNTGVDYVILLGFILITSLVSMVTLFSPINGYVTGIFAGAGVLLTYIYRRDLKTIFAGIGAGWRAMSWPLKLAVGLVFGLAMCSVVLEFGESDVWFYHSQSIKWIKEYAVVPGLGNLHGRFAFNSHFFISSAFFTLWFSNEYVVFPLMSLFFFLFSVRLMVNIRDGLAEKRWDHLIVNSVLALTCIFQLYPEINGTSTDGISAVILLYAFFLFMEPGFSETRISGLVLLWALVMTAVTFKLSSVFAGIILLFTLPRIFRSKKITVFLVAGLLIIGPFITRNIILSGYLLYPVPQLDVLSVDWKIPMDEVILEKELVSGWAKLPSGGAVTPIEDIPKVLSMPFGPWFKAWWPNQSLKWQAIMIIDLFTIALAFIAFFRKNHTLAIVSFTVAFNLIFWFLEAPRPRFGFAFLFLGLALVAAYFFAPLLRHIRLNKYLFLPLSLLIVLSVIMKNGIHYTDRLNPSLLLIPHYYQVNSEPLIFKAKNLSVNTPPAEPPARGIWCYNLPLPCTPFPKETLVMRGRTYQQGFRVDKDTPDQHE